MEDKILIKKNLLDLDMQKYLQLASTSVVICFSYFIGVFIVIISNRINFSDPAIYRLFVIVTVFVMGYTFVLFFISFKKIQRITKSIRNMISLY